LAPVKFFFSVDFQFSLIYAFSLSAVFPNIGYAEAYRLSEHINGFSEWNKYTESLIYFEKFQCPLNSGGIFVKQLTLVG
jgi:hypothetical protein